MSSTSAAARQIQPENIPDPLKKSDQWLCWSGEWDEAKKKLNKVPKKFDGTAGSSTNETTWTTFENALGATGGKGLDGIGFGGLERTPFVGIDIDRCISIETGEISPYAMKLVQEFDSYTERTVSGTGLRIWIEAEKLPGSWCGSKNAERELEVYSQGRFFTVTGLHLDGTPRTIEKRQEALNTFMKREAPPEKPKPNKAQYSSPREYRLELDEFLQERGVMVLGPRNDQSSERAYAIVCPWTREHTGGDTSGTRVGQYPSGALWFKCDHAHCDGRVWEHFREHLQPGVYERLSVPINLNGSKPKSSGKTYTRSDLGNAERFVDMHGDKVRWCPARKSWFLYDGTRWAPDERGHVVKLAHETARSIFRDAAHETDEAQQKEIAKFAVSSQNKNRIDGMLSQAKPYLAVSMDELDRDPWDLNCKNGTLGLRTGELRAHDPADLITRVVPVEYDPAARCPRFRQFLKETLVDETVISFMKRYAGYTLTGITRERLFAILWGGGKNGKTTLVEILQDAMGDYASSTDTETILAKKYQGVGNDVAALKAARFVSAAEVERGRRLAESKVKQLTGSDTVTARFLFGEPFDFRPQFKLWLSTNNKPVIQGTDDAIWDRIRLIPFERRFQGNTADLKLPEKLREELAGILAWMVEGCLEWQAHGLGEPESVKAATDQYRSDMDTLAAFIEDRCIVRRDATAQATPLYQQYRIWCDSAGEHADTQKAFGMRLTERGFESVRASSGVNKGRKVWRGIGLMLDTDPPGGGDDRSPGERSSADRSPDESGVGIGNTPGGGGSGERSEPTNQQVPLDTPRVYNKVGKRFTSFTSFTADEKATVEEAQTNSTNSETHTPDEPVHRDPEAFAAWEETF